LAYSRDSEEARVNLGVISIAAEAYNVADEVKR
jgi:hypothetical protein